MCFYLASSLLAGFSQCYLLKHNPWWPSNLRRGMGGSHKIIRPPLLPSVPPPLPASYILTSLWIHFWLLPFFHWACFSTAASVAIFSSSRLQALLLSPRHNCNVQRAPRVAVEVLDSTSLGWLCLETRLSGSSEPRSSDTAVVSAVAYVEQILQRCSQNSVESQFRSGHEKCFRSTEISHLVTWSPTLILHRNRQAWEGKRCWPQHLHLVQQKPPDLQPSLLTKSPRLEDVSPPPSPPPQA